MSEDPYHTEFVSWREDHFSFFFFFPIRGGGQTLSGKFHYFFSFFFYPSLISGYLLLISDLSLGYIRRHSDRDQQARGRQSRTSSECLDEIFQLSLDGPDLTFLYCPREVTRGLCARLKYYAAIVLKFCVKSVHAYKFILNTIVQK